MYMSKRAREADEIRRRKAARQRFRKLVRSVSLNRIWLQDVGEQKLTLNVKKNIAMLVRPQRKIGLLTMAEKSLIRTHHSLRTDEERKQLVSLMLGLTCFVKLPPKTRARLVPCIKFMVIDPGHRLIKEGDIPQMVYFLLTGEVEVSKRVYDAVTKSWTQHIELIQGPGDCVGDIEMLERCRRRHTYTTANITELLVVFDDDFERLLRPIMEKQWLEKKSAIQTLDYFQSFNRDQIIDACKLSVLHQFEPLETIYYEDKGPLSYVHFVVSGECMILQCLQMKVTQKNGKSSYDLVDLTSADHTSNVFDGLTSTELVKLLRNQKSSTKKATPDEVEQLLNSEVELTQNDVLPNTASITSDCLRENIRNHFIDVGSVNFDGIFGLGEKFEHCVIMARTTVQCLMIPRFWLFEKNQNPGNIWQRRRFYLDTTVPSRQILFENFLTTRQWQGVKEDIIGNCLGQVLNSNPTQIEDVPVISRITETND